MKIADLLADRRTQWYELDQLCVQLESSRTKRLPAPVALRFAALYRSACADLALADAYHLPPNTVQFLHQLVGRAHNQLYRSRTFHVHAWAEMLLQDVPRRIFSDGCVQVAFLLFWGIFLLSAFLAASPRLWPDYTDRVMGVEQIQQGCVP